MVKCIFREPEFPLLCDVGGVLVGALSLAEFSRHVAVLDLPPDADLVVVDASAEGWVFNTKHRVLSPLTFKKRWTKKEVITLFNRSDVARKLEGQYSERSLSAKRFDRIMAEIVALIRAAASQAIDAGASNSQR
jgi:hypothetical protein